jgi:hypothetical protein
MITLDEYKNYCAELEIPFDGKFYAPDDNIIAEQCLKLGLPYSKITPSDEFIKLKLDLAKKFKCQTELKFHKSPTPELWILTNNGWLEISENNNVVYIVLNGIPSGQYDSANIELFNIISDLVSAPAHASGLMH